ncbi:MAG TPA: glycosyltransferase family 4 protein [Clostridiaceae bacterium]|nr:glycosyltransferase family 4 protein [Clostridiaceae bacterium]
MRILMLSWEYPPRIIGGISRVVHDLSHKLGEMGNDINVVTCWENGTKEIELQGNVTVHRVRPYENSNNFIQWVLQLNFALLECCIKIINQKGSFDIIHSHDWMVAFASRTLKHAYKIPLISTIHATEWGRNGGIHNSIQSYIHGIEWWLTYESWKVIVNSYYMKKEVAGIFNLPEDKIHVIHNGVDVNKFNDVARDQDFRRKFAQDNEKIIFFVGRLVNEKGVQILVESMPKIIKNYWDVKFVIAGKGPQLDYLRQRVGELQVADKVYFTGYVSEEELKKLYKCADIAVFPSLYEPFGIVALEGMLAEVPVVVSDTGGLGEIVQHGIDGMTAYVGNSNSLADCILELLFNPEKAESIRKSALTKVYSSYNWDIIAKHTMDVYHQVLSEKNKSSW